MIIIAYKPGQLGNALFLYSKFIAYGIENHVKLKNPSFHPYANYFEKTSSTHIASYPPSKNIFSLQISGRIRYFLSYYIARIIYRLKLNNSLMRCIWLDWDDSLDINSNPELLNSKFMYIQGWQFNAKRIIAKHAVEIKAYFQPGKSHINNIERFFNDIKKEDTTFVGVHIRHGDYNNFEGGRYYYSFEEYTHFMNQVYKILPHRNIHFVICSNTQLNPKYFSKFSFSFGPNHELEDMLVLSKCDYIIGPPSTFTMWASFYGKTPLAMLDNKNKEISIKDFKVNNG